MIEDTIFGHWFAGFVDGEGCFHIQKETNRQGFRCLFSIGLRKDDGEILHIIQQKLGIGKIHIKNTANLCEFVVANKKGCEFLCQFFF